MSQQGQPSPVSEHQETHHNTEIQSTESQVGQKSTHTEDFALSEAGEAASHSDHPDSSLEQVDANRKKGSSAQESEERDAHLPRRIENLSICTSGKPATQTGDSRKVWKCCYPAGPNVLQHALVTYEDDAIAGMQGKATEELRIPNDEVIFERAPRIFRSDEHMLGDGGAQYILDQMSKHTPDINSVNPLTSLCNSLLFGDTSSVVNKYGKLIESQISSEEGSNSFTNNDSDDEDVSVATGSRRPASFNSKSSGEGFSMGSSERVFKEGFLFKKKISKQGQRSASQSMSWTFKKRWCKLMEGKLAYFASKQDASPLGQWDLHNAKMSFSPGDNTINLEVRHEGAAQIYLIKAEDNVKDWQRMILAQTQSSSSISRNAAAGGQIRGSFQMDSAVAREVLSSRPYTHLLSDAMFGLGTSPLKTQAELRICDRDDVSGDYAASFSAQELKFVVTNQEFQFNFKIDHLQHEPLFCSLSVHDIKRRVKVTEDVAFTMNADKTFRINKGSSEISILDFRRDKCGYGSDDSSMLSCKCAFRIAQPTPSLYLVLWVNKVLQNKNTKNMRPYLLDSVSKTDKWSKKILKGMKRYGAYHQAFLWGFCPLLEQRTQDNGLSEYFLLDGKRSMDRLYRVEGDVQSPFDVYEYIQYEQHPGAFAFIPASLKEVVKAKFDFEISGYNKHPPQPCLNPDSRVLKGPGGTVPNGVLPQTKEAMQLDNFTPLLDPAHLLYVYPKALNLVTDVLRFDVTVVMKVALKVDDTEGKNDDNGVWRPTETGLQTFFGRGTEPALSSFLFADSTIRTIHPQFHDELKARMPLPLGPEVHLLFTFFSVKKQGRLSMIGASNKKGFDADCGLPHLDGCQFERIGYSVVPLVHRIDSAGTGAQDQFLVPLKHTSVEVPIVDFLQPSYLKSLQNIHRQQRGKHRVFSCQIKMVSCWYSQDPFLAKFFCMSGLKPVNRDTSKKRTHSQIALWRADMSARCRCVHSCSNQDLMQFVPVVFHELFKQLCDVYAVEASAISGGSMQETNGTSESEHVANHHLAISKHVRSVGAVRRRVSQYTSSSSVASVASSSAEQPQSELASPSSVLSDDSPSVNSWLKSSTSFIALPSEGVSMGVDGSKMAPNSTSSGGLAHMNGIPPYISDSYIGTFDTLLTLVDVVNRVGRSHNCEPSKRSSIVHTFLANHFSPAGSSFQSLPQVLLMSWVWVIEANVNSECANVLLANSIFTDDRDSILSVGLSISWFFADAAVKALALQADEAGVLSTVQKRADWSEETHIQPILELLTSRVLGYLEYVADKRHRTAEKVNVSKEDRETMERLEISASKLSCTLALFLRDLSPLLDPDAVRDCILHFLEAANPPPGLLAPGSENVLNVHLDALDIFLDTRLLLEYGGFSIFDSLPSDEWSAVLNCKPACLSSLAVCELRRHLTETEWPSRVRIKAIDIILNMVTKLDCDSKYQSDAARLAVAHSLFGIVETVASADKHFFEVELTPHERRALCVIVLQILRLCGEQSLRQRLSKWSSRTESDFSAANWMWMLRMCMLELGREGCLRAQHKNQTRMSSVNSIRGSTTSTASNADAGHGLEVEMAACTSRYICYSVAALIVESRSPWQNEQPDSQDFSHVWNFLKLCFHTFPEDRMFTLTIIRKFVSGPDRAALMHSSSSAWIELLGLLLDSVIMSSGASAFAETEAGHLCSDILDELTQPFGKAVKNADEPELPPNHQDIPDDSVLPGSIEELGSTIPGLILQLTHPRGSAKITSEFLIIFRTYTTPEYVLNRLIRRYEGMSSLREQLFAEAGMSMSVISPGESPGTLHTESVTASSLLGNMMPPKSSASLSDRSSASSSMTSPTSAQGLARVASLVRPDSVSQSATVAQEPENAKPAKMECIRCINTIKLWLESHFHDFTADSLSVLVRFSLGLRASSTKTGLEHSKAILKPLVKEAIAMAKKGGAFPSEDETGSARSNEASSKSKKKKTSFWDLTPAEIAQQLTLVEHDLFRQIRPQEFQGQAWSKKDKERRAPNILRFINRFNDVSNWVASTIMSTENLKDRRNVVATFINIAKEFKKNNNFNGVLEVISGLGNSAVHRLKRTWDGISDRHEDELEVLRQLMSQDKSYKAFREQLTKSNGACVPYLGVFLTDLTFLDDGNKDFESDGVVNVSKCKKMAGIVQKLQMYQQESMAGIKRDEQILRIIESMPKLNEKTLYDESLRIEPRQQSS